MSIIFFFENFKINLVKKIIYFIGVYKYILKFNIFLIIKFFIFLKKKIHFSLNMIFFYYFIFFSKIFSKIFFLDFFKKLSFYFKIKKIAIINYKLFFLKNLVQLINFKTQYLFFNKYYAFNVNNINLII